MRAGFAARFDAETLLALLGPSVLGLYEWRRGEEPILTPWDALASGGTGASSDRTPPPVGKWRTNVRPADRERLTLAWKAFVSGGTESFEADYRLHRADGGGQSVRDRAIATERDARGDVKLAAGVVFDLEPVRVPYSAEQERAQLQRLSDALPVLVWVSDPAGGGTFFNREWCRYTGRNQEELSGTGWQADVHPDDVEGCRRFATEHDDATGPLTKEFRLRGADGDYRLFLASAAPRLDADGRFLGFVCVCQDIQVRGELTRRLRSTQFSVDNAAEAIFWVRRDASFAYWNEYAIESIGYTPEEMERLRVPDIDVEIGEEDWPPLWQRIEEEHEVLLESVIERKDGSRFPVEVSVRRLEGDEGLLCASLRDLTSIRRADRAVRAAKERFDRAVAGTSDGLWDWDIGTDEVWYAPRFRELLGFGGDDTEGFPNLLDAFARHLHPSDREGTWSAVYRALDEDAVYDVEYRLRTRESKWRWFRARGRVTRDDEGKALLMSGSIQDIHDRKRDEERLRVYAEELERSNKDLNSFADAASHDLKQPLRSISSMAQLIEEEVGDDLSTFAQESLDKLRQRVRRMDQLLGDLLRYSQVTRSRAPSEVVDIDIEEIVEEIRELVNAPKGFEILAEGPFPPMRAERTPLAQVLRNLVSNAVKHRVAEGGYVVIRAKEDGNRIAFEVRDDGPGIEPEYHGRIFEMFRTLKPRDEVEGSGLGLSMVQRLVELRGGKVSVESEPGQGATFRFTWPAREETRRL